MPTDKPEIRTYTATSEDDPFISWALKKGNAPTTITETCYRNEEGQLHRDQGPARIIQYACLFDHPVEEFHSNGVLCKRTLRGFLRADSLLYEETTSYLPTGDIGYSTDRPAQRTICIDNGITVEERFCIDDEQFLHRMHGPALIQRDPDTGVTTLVLYAQNGKWHRPSDEGPTCVERDKLTGLPLDVSYYRHDKLHNEHGPAQIVYDQITGLPARCRYFKNGIETKQPESQSNANLQLRKMFP